MFLNIIIILFGYYCHAIRFSVLNSAAWRWFSSALLSTCQTDCSSSSDTSAGQRFPPHNRTLGIREFRVGGGVHDSYTFQCVLVGSFTSPGIDTR